MLFQISSSVCVVTALSSLALAAPPAPPSPLGQPKPVAPPALDRAKSPKPSSSSSAVNTTTCGGQTYVYQELAGYGLVASNARDKFGDTLGGIGSSIAIDQKSWKKQGQSYTGTLWALPDRGWNTQGTLNFQNRVHKFQITLALKENATVKSPSGPNLQMKYLDTVLLTDPSGTPTTGLDAAVQGPYLNFSGLPEVPSATYVGDGFGRNGTGGKRVSVDSEGLVLSADGSFWISDEYGPYIYKFSPKGKMMEAIRPPNAFIPLRNGTESFSADSAPIYDPDFEVDPEDPTSGRSNNQGFEGLTASPDGKKLYALLQSATVQEGGLKKKNRRYTRLVQYDISGSEAVYEAEYVVPLPIFDGDTVAAQSEIHYISSTQFLILARDSNAGHGQDDTLSLYRHADVFDISNATDIKSAANDAFNGAIASSKGNLKSGIQPATYCSFLDFNVNSQLNRFGVHNGGASDSGLLNEKWESLALAPVNGDGSDGQYFLFSLSDNDFITQDGHMDFGNYTYSDASGYNLDNQALVFKVTLPKGSRPS